MIRYTRQNFLTPNRDLSFTAEKTAVPAKVMNQDDQYRIIRALFACPNGVQRMSQAMKGLVETSNNLAIVNAKTVNSKLTIFAAARSIQQKKPQHGRLPLFFILLVPRSNLKVVTPVGNQI